MEDEGLKAEFEQILLGNLMIEAEGKILYTELLSVASYTTEGEVTAHSSGEPETGIDFEFIAAAVFKQPIHCQHIWINVKMDIAVPNSRPDQFTPEVLEAMRGFMDEYTVPNSTAYRHKRSRLQKFNAVLQTR